MLEAREPVGEVDERVRVVENLAFFRREAPGLAHLLTVHALIGFGLDSVIEVSSAAAVAWQFSARDHAVREQREKTTLRIIAVSFFALAAYVTVDAVRALTGTGGAEPVPGIVIAALSLAAMPFLSAAQRRAGRELGSASAVADSQQTLLCMALHRLVAGQAPGADGDHVEDDGPRMDTYTRTDVSPDDVGERDSLVTASFWRGCRRLPAAIVVREGEAGVDGGTAEFETVRKACRWAGPPVRTAAICWVCLAPLSTAGRVRSSAGAW
ncbi:cation efflux protein [Streptomyces laurentii]|uniref:Cation efflux protein n=1 Tax=Streptomyces laurentii TaxID=39478 RepID=A0A160P761_STRLU|nr:cation efflux protein [Streptomyces laurentii]